LKKSTSILAVLAAALALPTVAAAQPKTIKAVMHSDLKGLEKHNADRPKG